MNETQDGTEEYRKEKKISYDYKRFHNLETDELSLQSNFKKEVKKKNRVDYQKMWKMTRDSIKSVQIIQINTESRYLIAIVML